jgi:hypothetical protein
VAAVASESTHRADAWATGGDYHFTGSVRLRALGATSLSVAGPSARNDAAVGKDVMERTTIS